MKNGISPGTDRFSVEFYRMVCSDLKQYILRSYNHAFKQGQLSITQKQGVISIIPKCNKPQANRSFEYIIQTSYSMSSQ